MGEVKINDVGLFKFCHAKVADLNPDQLEGDFPKDHYASLGEYGLNGKPLWAVNAYAFREHHDCKLDIAMDLQGLFSPQLFRRMACVVFDYVFKQAKLIRCTIEVRASNKKSLKLVRKWGFQVEGLKRDGYAPPKLEDMVLLGMTKDECKWI